MQKRWISSNDDLTLTCDFILSTEQLAETHTHIKEQLFGLDKHLGMYTANEFASYANKQTVSPWLQLLAQTHSYTH